MPLIGYGDVIGILFVRRASGAYSERHLRTLAIVGGQLGAYLSMVRAHDEIQERARELDDARRAALVVNRAKDEFLAVVAHELKEPVASTLAWAHILVPAKSDPAGPSRAIAAIERNARSLARLVDDIQGLSCVASAELRLDLRAIDPAHELKAAIVRIQSGDGGAALELTPAAPEPPAAKPAPPAVVVRETVRELDGIHVLLVDDDPDILDAFQSVLEHYGAEVTAVTSAAAALRALARSRPDALLCDLAMPGESGYDLMREIVARDAALPAAALTAFGELADPKRALAAGFRLQLGKPIEATALVAAVADLAGRPPATAASRQLARLP